MVTAKQKLGEYGESLVTKYFDCPRCKHSRSLRRLPTNFKCADIVCDFCGYLAQVKTKRKEDINGLPSSILGGAWSVQKERMDAGIYFPLFIVLINEKKKYTIYYLSADLQPPDMFVARKPLRSSAKRAGWQGFLYNLNKVPKGAIVRIKG